MMNPDNEDICLQIPRHLPQSLSGLGEEVNSNYIAAQRGDSKIQSQRQKTHKQKPNLSLETSFCPYQN